MENGIIDYLTQFFSNPIYTTVIISMLPIVELRGAIPWAYFFGGLSLVEAAFYSIIGNFLMCIPIYLFFHLFTELLRKYNFGVKWTDWLFNRTRKKGEMINDKKLYGLILFVGIPFPATGAWTGTLAAYIFGLSLFKSLLGALIGLLISATIVCSLISMGMLFF